MTEQNDLSFIAFFADRIGKPLHAFSKADWKAAALAASGSAESLYNRAYPVPGKPGRPKKNRNAYAASVLSTNAKRRRGRPTQLFFGKYSIEVIDAVLRDLKAAQSPISTKWPDAPKDQRNHLKALLRIFRLETGRYHDLQSVERALRRHRARVAQESSKVGGHNSS